MSRKITSTSCTRKCAKRRFGIGRRAGDLDAPGLPEEPRQPFDRQRFIVHEVGAQHVILSNTRYAEDAKVILVLPRDRDRS